MATTDLPFDPEAIAALLDGRLSGEARARILERLAGSERAFEAFVASARFQLAREGATGEVLPFRAKRPVPAAAWRRLALPIAAAAALILIASPFLIRSLRGPRLPALAGVELAMELAGDGLAARLGANWDDRPWSVMRGGSSGLVEPELAFRLGVRAVDLQVALRLGEIERAKRLVDEMLTGLGEVGMSQPVAARYTSLRDGLGGDTAGGLVAVASDAEGVLEDFLASPQFTFGKWSGAAELAARARQTSFFESQLTTSFLDWGTGSALGAEDAEALRRVRALTDLGFGGAALEELQALLRAIIGRNAG